MRVVDRRWWARTEPEAEKEAPRERKEDLREPRSSGGEDLEDQLAQTRQQLQAVLVEHRRATDEFEQARARMRRDVALEIERGQRAVLVEMLDVIDNLDRAIDAAQQSDAEASADTLLRGVELVREQFLSKLAALNVVRLEALGTVFDPVQHDAVAVAPAEDPELVGRIVAIVREGYAIGDEVLRPAAVVVASDR